MIGAVAGLPAFKAYDNITYVEQLMAQDMITIKNTTPFGFKSQVSINAFLSSSVKNLSIGPLKEPSSK